MSITSHTDMHFSSVSCNCPVTWYTVRTVEHVILQYLRPFWAQVYVHNQRLARWSRTRSCPTASGKGKPAGRPWMCFKPNLNGNYYFCVFEIQRPLTGYQP